MAEEKTIPLTAQEDKFAINLMDTAQQIIDFRNVLYLLSSRHRANKLSASLSDEKFKLNSRFEHLDTAKVTAGVGAIDAVLTAIDDNLDSLVAVLP